MPRRTEKFGNYDSEAYTDDGKVWRWVSNNSVITVQTCNDYGIPCDEVAQEAARQKHVDGVVDNYRRNQPATPSAEEQYEMRAAFGSGKEVVDVITGRRFST